MDYFLRTYDEEYHWQWFREYPSIGTTVLHPSMEHFFHIITSSRADPATS